MTAPNCGPLLFALACSACQSPSAATVTTPAPEPPALVAQWAAAPGFPALRISSAKGPASNTVPAEGALLEVLNDDGNVLDSIAVRGLAADIPLRLHRGELRDYMRHAPDIVQADINGDSSPDLLVRTGREGSYGGPSFDVFLNDSKTGRYQLSKALTRLGVGRMPLVYEGGLITTGAKDGCCLHVQERYRLEGECLLLIDRTTMDSRVDNTPTKVTVERGGSQCE